MELDLSTLGENDRTETHMHDLHAITFVWFKARLEHHPLGLRILGREGRIEIATLPTAEHVRGYVDAWRRVGEFLDANPSLEIVNVYGSD